MKLVFLLGTLVVIVVMSTIACTTPRIPNKKIESSVVTSGATKSEKSSKPIIDSGIDSTASVSSPATSSTTTNTSKLLAPSSSTSSIGNESSKDLVLIEDHYLTFPNTVASSIFNAELALKYVNGYILPAGKIFSFNTVVGERTKARGFISGPLVKGYGIGGGVCKASTILYQAARDAGLTIIERHNHSIIVPYAKPGTDAMVSWPGFDNRFLNNKSYDLLFKCSLTGNIGNVKIYEIIR